MKKILILFLVMWFGNTMAQTLEHTYDAQISISKTKPNEMVYYYYNQKSREIFIYNLDHTFIMSIKAKVSDTILYAGLVTRTLFNSNNSFEFALNGGKTFYIIGEDGNIIFSKSGGPNIYSIQSFAYNTTNGTKMNLLYNYITTNIYSYKTEVYSLEGMLLNKKDLTKDETYLPYPNPTTQFITLQTSNKPDEDATIEIYNNTGQLMDSFIAKGTISYDTFKLEPGIYYYKSNGTYSGNFIKE